MVSDRNSASVKTKAGAKAKRRKPRAAPEILEAAAGHILSRGKSRDQPNGERSMARTVAAFNALTGHQLSERDGWMFMVCLKGARACTPGAPYDPDDYEDGLSYFALAGECAESLAE